MKKRILTAMLGLTMVAMLAGCGGAKNPSAPADGQNGSTGSTQNATATGERTSENMYMDFLAGTEKAYTDKLSKTRYNEDTDTFTVYYDAPNGMTIKEMLGTIIECEGEYDPIYLREVSYTFIDCGVDGEPELAVRAYFDTGYMDDMTFEFVLKNIDGKLQLCHQMDSYYRSYTGLANTKGYITSSGSTGAAGYYFSTGFVDANGDYHFVYDGEECYYAAWALDDRFQDAINEEYGEEDDSESYITYYDFVEYSNENWDEILKSRIYCAEFDDEYYDVLNSEENVARMQSVFDKVGVKLYTRAEIDAALEAREKELGMDPSIKEYEEFEWAVCEMNLNEINGIKEVTVNNVDELMNALDSNTSITLAPGTYNVTEWLLGQIRKGRIAEFSSYDYDTDEYAEAEYYGETQIFYTGTTAEPGLVVRGLSSCTLRSADAKNPAQIVSDPRGEDVLYVKNSDRLTFENIVMGHTDGNDECAGDVVLFSTCNNVLLTGCDLYGCGATGLDLIDCSIINVEDSIIHDCSVGAVYVSDTYGANFNNTTFDSIEGFGMLSSSQGSISLDNCTFKNPLSNMFSSWFGGYATFYNCTFEGNLEEEIRNHEGFEDYINIYNN